jgi:hypothetical protein
MREIVVHSGADAHVQEVYGKLEERADGRGAAFCTAFMVNKVSVPSYGPFIRGKSARGSHEEQIPRWWPAGNPVSSRWALN